MYRTCLVCLLGLLLATTARSAEPEAKAKEALVDLNQMFRDAHAAARKLDLDTGGPVILLEGDELILVHQGKRTPARIVAPEYDTFKTFAHLPVAIYLMLGPPGQGDLDAQRLEQLRAFRLKLDRVEAHLDRIGLDGSHLERQKQMVAAARQFLDTVIARKQVSRDELLAYTRSMTNPIKANLAGAAKAQLDGIHQQVLSWKKELTKDEWARLRVVVKGAVLARDGNLAKQYFEHLLGLQGEGLRLIYLESYYPPTPSLTLLTTHAVDRGIGIAIFDDPLRMHRDVLADAAAAYLKQMKFE